MNLGNNVKIEKNQFEYFKTNYNRVAFMYFYFNDIFEFKFK